MLIVTVIKVAINKIYSNISLWVERWFCSSNAKDIGALYLMFVIAFSGLELGIAFIQSQVFVVLSCSYIKDALELH